MVASATASRSTRIEPALSTSSTPRENIPPLIDTIRLRGPVSDYDPSTIRLTRRADPKTGVIVEDGAAAVYVLAPGTRLRVDHLSGHSMASWEFSAPRALRGENTRGATVSELTEAVEWLFGEASQWVTWSVKPEDLRVMRLDLVNDIRVGDVPSVLGALHRGATRASVKSALHSGRDFETLTRGYPGRWRVQGYDKYAEVLSTARRCRDEHRRALLNRRAPSVRGVLRTEVQLRHHILEPKGISTMSDIDEDRMSGISGHYIHRAGLDSVLLGQEDMQRAERALFAGPDRKQAAAVVGLMRAIYLGVDPKTTADPKTLRARLDIAARYGLTPAMFEPDPGPSIRLNYALNQVEEVVA